jgi:hypothetical protein
MQKLKTRKRLSTLVLALLLTVLVGSAFAFRPGVLSLGASISINPDDFYVGWVAWGHGDYANLPGVGTHLPAMAPQRDASGTNVSTTISGGGNLPGTGGVPADITWNSGAFDVYLGFSQNLGTVGRAGQFLPWEMTFNEAGWVSQQAAILNASDMHDADIFDVQIHVFNNVSGEFVPDGLVWLADEFGITFPTWDVMSPTSGEWSPAPNWHNFTYSNLAPSTTTGFITVVAEWDGVTFPEIFPPAPGVADLGTHFNSAFAFLITFAYQVSS